MTDREKLEAVFQEVGLVPQSALWSGTTALAPNEFALCVDEQPKVKGYGGFYACFVFDDEGNLQKVSIAE